MTMRRPALLALALAAATPALAPAPAQPPRPAAPPAPLALAPEAAKLDEATAVERTNGYLNSVRVLTGDFVQFGADGRRYEGKLYIQKPGKLRFEYKAPSPLEIVSDGSSVVVRDRKLNTQDMYAIGQTPLKFLLKDRIDLAKDSRVLRVASDRDAVNVVIEDKATLGGTSRISLFLDPGTYALKRWIIRDPQGYETNVALSNLDTAGKVDPALFTINYQRDIVGESANK